MIVKSGEKLRRARRRAGYNQVEIARLVGVTQQYISALECGSDRDCSERVAERLCTYLNVDQEDQFDRQQKISVDRSATRSRGSRNVA